MRNANDIPSNSIFYCQIENAKCFADILTSLLVKKEAFAKIQVAADGMRLKVGEDRTLAGYCALRRDFFFEYALGPTEPLEFRVPLHVFASCLASFPSERPVPLTMHYAGHGFPFYINLREENAVTDCGLVTLEIDEPFGTDPLFFSSHAAFPCVVGLRSADLQEALSSLDFSGDTLRVTLSSVAPGCTLQVTSATGSSAVELDCSTAADTYNCSSTLSATYSAPLFATSLKVLSCAFRTLLKMSSDGLLCFEHVLKFDQQHTFSIFFYYYPHSN